MNEGVESTNIQEPDQFEMSTLGGEIVIDPLAPTSTNDYERIAEAINYLANNAQRQPSLDDVARHMHMSPFHFQRLFSRWAGVTPKRFLQVLTVDRAKTLLDEARPLLDVSTKVGLSSASRLHDHFVQLEAMTPGQFKRGGAEVRIEYGVHTTPFGPALLAATQRGVCSFTFADITDDESAETRLATRWPNAQLQLNRGRTGSIVRSMFESPRAVRQPISLHVSGTNFQIHVWRALLQLQPTQLTSYSRLAVAVGRPGAARAVGQAVGANPVAFLIPCHRVIQQTGQLGGYHWGMSRKLAIQAWEQSRAD